ncbi:MAG: peptide chain release factor N(5)-glutamine methyltransferase [Bacteroidetes bacterium]|nr:peptide chain release factor N(5)-glutamine methyltransferase [Bacteroidota bacterium]
MPHLEQWKELAGLYNARELQNMWRFLNREPGDINMPLVIERLKNKEPFDYILGHTEFYSLPFKVNTSVLIPRPETEELVDWILKGHKEESALNVLDIGTGSGCIAISLASQRSGWKVSASDISPDAIAVARENAILNSVEVDFNESDILHSIPNGTFDIVVSNPPYIIESESTVMSGSTLKYEPHEALFTGGGDALLFYRRIGEVAKELLTPGGRLYFEINEFRAQETTTCLEQMGYEAIVGKDLQKKDRMIRAMLRSSR